MVANRLKNSVEWKGGKWVFIRTLALFNANIKIEKDYESNGCNVLNRLLKKGKLYNFFIMCFAHDYCLDELHYNHKKSREVMNSAGKEFGVGWLTRISILSAVYIYDKVRGKNETQKQLTGKYERRD